MLLLNLELKYTVGVEKSCHTIERYLKRCDHCLYYNRVVIADGVIAGVVIADRVIAVSVVTTRPFYIIHKQYIIHNH